MTPRSPSAQPRPWRRLPNSGLKSLGAGVVTASGQINYALVPIFGLSSLTARIKTVSNGGTIDIFPVGPDFDPDGAGAFATATVDPAGANNSLVFTSKLPGFSGEQLSVAYVDPGANNAALAISIAANKEIVVSLATGVAGAITTTATLLAAAIAADAAASKLVSVANAGGNDGSGVVTAMAQAFLSIPYTSLVGTIYATGNPVQVNVTAATEALITLACKGEGYALIKYTGAVGAGSISYCDIAGLPIAGR